MESVYIKYLNNYDDSFGLIKQATEGSAGFDLRNMDSQIVIYPGRIRMFRTGISLGIPKGMEGQVRSRSGLATKGIFVLNSPGTIDSDYRGEIKVILANFGDMPFTIFKGDRIAQIVFCSLPQIKLIKVDDLEDTKRGEGGFGSTGIS